jgi:hypothetical protein
VEPKRTDLVALLGRGRRRCSACRAILEFVFYRGHDIENWSGILFDELPYRSRYNTSLTERITTISVRIKLVVVASDAIRKIEAKIVRC